VREDSLLAPPTEWVPGLRSPIPWTEALFLFRSHLGLTRDMIFTDNVSYWLLERPRVVVAPQDGHETTASRATTTMGGAR